jgi:hypothetical protein
MSYDKNGLTPEDYIMYRLYRFGETGRFGKVGPAKAGKHHGNVTARAWLMYEAGTRQPRIGEREKIARWLNSQAARQDRREKGRQAPERREANRAVKEQVLGSDYEADVLAKPI